MKKIAVLGATGYVGSCVVSHLEQNGNRVIKIVHTKGKRDAIVKKNPLDECRFADVEKFVEIRRIANRFRGNITLDGIIYAVGRYPKGEYAERLNSPLPHLSLKMIHRIKEEAITQLIGLCQVFEAMLPIMSDEGSIIIVSSVAYESLSHDVITYEAQEHLIRTIRHQPLVRDKNIRIHHLGFGPIHGPYYDGVHLPKKILSLETVVKDIITTLDCANHVSLKRLP